MNHKILMDAYYTMRDAWESAAEAATCGYAGDLEIWLVDHPRPTFKKFLEGSRS
jgi:hypothetical protein